MKTCEAVGRGCDRPALWEVRGFPTEGTTTPMCSYHAEPFFDERLASLFTTDGVFTEELVSA